MKRLATILLNLPTAVSLVPCLATVALWVRSYDVAEMIRWRTRDDHYRIESTQGALIAVQFLATSDADATLSLVGQLAAMIGAAVVGRYNLDSRRGGGWTAGGCERARSLWYAWGSLV